jgi:hypothetical protein
MDAATIALIIQAVINAVVAMIQAGASKEQILARVRSIEADVLAQQRDVDAIANGA